MFLPFLLVLCLLFSEPLRGGLHTHVARDYSFERLALLGTTIDLDNVFEPLGRPFHGCLVVRPSFILLIMHPERPHCLEDDEEAVHAQAENGEVNHQPAVPEPL